MTRSVCLGSALVGVAIWCLSAVAQSTYTSDPLMGAGSAALVTHFQELPSGPTVMTVVDSHARAVAVYHISRDTGAIRLKAVRNFAWDLRLEEFNGGSPTPEEIRQGLNRTE